MLSSSHLRLFVEKKELACGRRQWLVVIANLIVILGYATTMSLDYSKNNRRKEILRVVLSVAIIIVGITHFATPEPYTKIVPPQLPYPQELVYISGFFEILGGIGLLIPYVSVAAAWGLIALFIAVFPANINMAVNDISIEGVPHNQALYWARLPLQAVLIAWAWWYTRKPEEQPGSSLVAERMEVLKRSQVDG